MEIKARQAADEAKAKAEAGKNTVASGVKLVSRTQVESFEEVLTKGNFKIKSFTLTCKVNGVVKSYKSSDGEITKEMKQAVSQLKKGNTFFNFIALLNLNSTSMKLRVLYLMTGLILIATLSLSAQTTEVKPADIKKKAIKKEKVTQPSSSDTKGTAVKTEVKQSAKSTEVKGTKSEKGSSIS